MLFALSGGESAALVEVCARAVRVASLGYAFMGLTVAAQGVLQALGDPIKPLALALLRLVVFVFPVAYLFTQMDNVLNVVWWTFPIAEALTAVFAVIFLRQAVKGKIETL